MQLLFFEKVDKIFAMLTRERQYGVFQNRLQHLNAVYIYICKIRGNTRIFRDCRTLIAIPESIGRHFLANVKEEKEENSSKTVERNREFSRVS